MIKQYIIYFIFVIIPLILSAQNENIKFEHLNVNDGLASNRVTCILQDSEGFMWFGTENGLNKYDGYKFITYKPDPENPGSISHTYIWSMLEDTNGDIWIGTYGGGLNKFDRENELFVNYQNNPNDPNSISNNFVSSLCLSSSDDNRYMWVGTRWGGLNKFDLKLNKFVSYGDNFKEASDEYIRNIVALIEDQDGLLWIGTTNSGLTNINFKSHKFKRYYNDPEHKYSISDNHIRTILQDKSGILWIGTDNGLNKFDKVKQKFIRYQYDNNTQNSISDNRVLSICEGRNNDLIVGTFSGLNIFNTGDEEFIRVHSNKNDIYSLSNDYIKSIYQDITGIIWIGTLNGGISIFIPKIKPFNHVSIKQDDSNQTSNNSIRSIREDIVQNNKILWLGTAGAGLLKFNRETNIFKKIFGGNETVFVRSIYQNRKYPNTIWIGTWGLGLIKIDKKLRQSPKQVFWSQHPENKDAYHINTIYEIKPDLVWLGTGLGIYQFNLLSEEYTHLGHDPNDNNSLSHPNVTSILKDHLGRFWIGTYGGGLNKSRFNSDSTETYLKNNEVKFIRYKNNPDNPHSISNNTITFIYEDNNNNLWIGTHGGGLNKLVTQNPNDTNQSTAEFFRYGEKDGLASNIIVGILEENNGNLWLSTNKGISKFNPVNESFRNYDVRDGLQSNEFNRFAYFKSKNGEMFFGGLNGFNAFYPNEITDNLQIPPVVITDFQVFNKSIKPGKNAPLKKPVSEAKEITLLYDQSVFSFEFSALDYYNPEKNKYAYKMDGIDPDWVNTDATRRYATYTHLDPGEYTFRVKGSNNDGIWNDKDTSVKIIILPPWWKTWWAYSSYIILFILLIYYLRQYEHNRLSLKHKLELKGMEADKLLEMDHLKSRFFANISHEFRTPLTLILGPIEQLISGSYRENQKNMYLRIRHNAKRLLRLINQLLDLSRLEADKLQLKASPTDIVHITRSIIASFESMAKHRNINLIFRSDVENLLVWLDVDCYEKIINNLLSNAFKFSKTDSAITVDLNEKKPDEIFSKGSVEIKISDQGKGIPEEQIKKIFDRFYQGEDDLSRSYEGSGIGLALVKELVGLHYGTIAVNSIEGKGTTFSVELPLGKDNLSEDKIAIIPSTAIPDLVELEQDRSVEENIFESQRDQKKATILIVEDNEDMQLHIAEILENCYNLEYAGNGAEGLQIATKNIPDLILSDVMMPELNGMEMCEKLKTNKHTSHIPVILLTARAGEESKLQGLETGADDYLEKPFSKKELITRIKNLIEQRQKLREKFQREIIIKPNEVTVNSMDENLIKKAIAIVEKNMPVSDFNTAVFAREIGMSRSHLNAKMKALTGLATHEFIRSMRLKRAAQLLKQKCGNIADIAYQVGFSSLSHFSKAFRDTFGMLPSEYNSGADR
jgi:signal transduction histidine kinase/ligand-binding sensor domain-containing protein/CheY-like chemotaxis protein